MSQLDRRSFVALAAGAVAGEAASAAEVAPMPRVAGAPLGPTEQAFERDYTPPNFTPSWKRPQLNRLVVQDFVVFAHMDLDMTRKLLEKEPALVLASINWGTYDWESGLNAASHMGRRDIVELLLEHGARIDIFCAAMMGMLDVVQAFIKLQPKLIDAKGPHGFTLHFHAQFGGKESEKVLDYLQSVKKIELKANPFLKMKEKGAKKPSP